MRNMRWFMLVCFVLAGCTTVPRIIDEQVATATPMILPTVPATPAPTPTLTDDEVLQQIRDRVWSEFLKADGAHVWPTPDAQYNLWGVGVTPSLKQIEMVTTVGVAIHGCDLNYRRVVLGSVDVFMRYPDGVQTLKNFHYVHNESCQLAAMALWIPMKCLGSLESPTLEQQAFWLTYLRFMSYLIDDTSLSLNEKESLFRTMEAVECNELFLTMK